MRSLIRQTTGKSFVEPEFARHYYEAARGNHWWFRGRRDLIIELLRYTGAQSGVVLDLGAGSETLFPATFDVVKLDLVRPTGDLPHFVRAAASSLPFRSGIFSGVGAFDLLEHVDDVTHLIAEVKRVLKPGGFVLVTVPAHQWLWSPHDVRVGHVRRYNRKALRQIFEAALLEVKWCGSFFGFLLPAAILRKLFRLSPEMVDPAPILNRFLGLIASRSARSAARDRRPGLSIGLVATVGGDAS